MTIYLPRAISKVLAHDDHDATEVYEAHEVGWVMVMSRQDTAEVLQTGKQAFDLPAPRVATRSTAVLGSGLLAVGSVRSERFDTLLLQPSIRLVTAVRLVRDQPRTGIGEKPTLESIRDKGDFMWSSRCNVSGDRKTMAVCHGNALRTRLVAPTHSPPFFATTKVPSMKHSERYGRPRFRRSPAKVSRIDFSTPDCTHSWNNRWQVWYEGNRPGRSA